MAPQIADIISRCCRASAASRVPEQRPPARDVLRMGPCSVSASWGEQRPWPVDRTRGGATRGHVGYRNRHGRWRAFGQTLTSSANGTTSASSCAIASRNSESAASGCLFLLATSCSSSTTREASPRVLQEATRQRPTFPPRRIARKLSGASGAIDPAKGDFCPSPLPSPRHPDTRPSFSHRADVPLFLALTQSASLSTDI